ncbi:unnamed protein product [Miscanthus lutarioriparius]|uniref:Uncharacterized protein n=1 Tax=Miscanthus lutarioriparius TaxID=422564 RepID=A0A811RGS4_9POAL|nr:unnamed protein product [Miscanthus lutarioriparius]
MLPSKRGADDLTRFSADNKRNCSGEEATDLSISDIWSELSEEVASKLSRSVVSIALSNGQSVLYASSGIVIERQCNFTKFVTSASLVRALHDSEANGHDKLEIEVRHEGNVAIGFLEEYDLDHEIAVVKVMSVLDVYCMPLNHQVQFDPHGRKTMQGCALFYFYGNFFGMNLFWDMERPIFLPRSIILERLGHFHTSLKKIVFLNLVKPVRDKRRRRRIGVKLLPHPGGRIKIFGDIYPNGVWDELKEGVAPHICGNLVALASFNGESKLFACTGFFVDYYADKCPAILTSASLVRNRDGTIIEGLMIETGRTNYEKIEPHSSLPGPEAHIVKDGEKQPQNSWMGAGQSEDMDTLMDQDEGAANNERAAIAKPNRYWYRNGAFSVYK